MSKKLKLQNKPKKEKSSLTKWEAKIYGFSPSFANIVKADPKNTSKFICIVCTATSRTSDKPVYYKKNLKSHLLSGHHGTFTSDQEELKTCIKALGIS